MCLKSRENEGSAVKAIFLDMDETLCDTTGADRKLKTWLEKTLLVDYFDCTNTRRDWSEHFLLGIYKKYKYQAILACSRNSDEKEFRISLIMHLFNKSNYKISYEQSSELLNVISDKRMEFFSFFYGVDELLIKLRKNYLLVVITNGPVLSQVPKLSAVSMENYVDHIIIGGEEPEEKPHSSIFKKALILAGIDKREAIHVGDSYEADILGADSVNICSVWVNLDAKNKSFEKGKAHYSVESVLDLPKVISIIEKEKE